MHIQHTEKPLIPLCLFSLWIFAQGTTKEFKFGVLLPMTGRWPIGTRIAAAVPLCVQDIMDDKTLLHGYNVSYTIYDSACVLDIGLRGMVQFKGMDFIIGPACSVVAGPVALMGKIWNKPMITYAASSIKFIDKTMYTTFATMTAYGRRNQQYTPTFVAKLMQAFNWTVCAVISSSEVEWKTMANKIHDVIKPVTNISMFETYENKNPEFVQMLSKGKTKARVFLLLCYVNEVTKIMEAARNLGMINGQYAFVTIDLNTDVFYSNGQWTGNDGPGSKLNEGLNGIVDFSVYRPALTDNFKTRLKNMEGKLESEIRAHVSTKFPASWYAAFLYDAIWLAALALNATFADGFNVNSTAAVVDRMFNRRFTGKSGNVVMENGTRMPHFVVGNIVNGTYVSILNQTSLGGDPGDIESTMSGIIWPGGSKTVPLSVPPCGFDDLLCSDTTVTTSTTSDNLSMIIAVSGACVLVALLLGLLVFMRKRRLDKENTYMAWVIPYKDITPSQEQEINNRAQSQISQECGSLVFSNFSLHNNPASSAKAFKVGIYKGRKVYIKRPPHDAINMTSKCKNEIRMACELRHVNINPCLGVCLEPLDICIVTEYCSKGSLQNILLDDNLKLDWTFKMSFAMDIARGMEELHKSAIGRHGRLKSTNVVVDGYWICKVADYGLCSFRRSYSELQTDQQKSSDLLWTAPEFLRGTDSCHDREQAQAGDMYAFGIILQEIALREAPFSTSLLSAKEITYHVKKGMKPNCRPHVPPDSAPQSYRDLMSQCWDEAPERRPTFSGVVKMLRRINNGRVTNIVDNMLSMMGKYTNDLESLVKERTKQLESEKSKTDELLYKMMPRSVADQLKAGSTMKAESYSEVTILCSGIVDFTDITAMSDPMQVIYLLNDVYSLYDTIIGRYDVYKVETVGDSCLVVSGLPERNGNRHASEIAAMSLHLLTYIKDFKIDHLPDLSLKFRMGIHTGPCVAGIVGLKTPRYDIFGETVNAAKHLEAAGLAQQIHLSRSCKQILDKLGGFAIETRGEMFIKGIGDTTTYFLRGKER